MSNVFQSDKIAISAKMVNGGSFPPRLKPDIYNSNPQLFVLTGMKKGEGVTYIRAGMEIKTAGILCEAIIALADETINKFTRGDSTPRNNQETSVIKVECKAGKEKELVTEIVVGKNKEGKMFICLVDKKNQKAPVIQFFFGTDYYHPINVSNLDNFGPDVISCLAAKSWAIRSRDFWHGELIKNPEVKENKGKGGYNNNSNSNNNFNSDSGGSNAWDDEPF